MRYVHFIWVLLLPAMLNAQKDEAQQIIITKKGDLADKTTIVIDGDKITVDGKPLQPNDKNLIVERKKIKDLKVYNELPGNAGSYRRGPTQQWQNITVTPNKAMLGVKTQESTKGLRVEEVTKNSAAEKAGLQPNDILISVDQKKLSNPEDLFNLIKEKKPGELVKIQYSRNGKTQQTTAILTPWEMPEGFNAGGGNMDIPGINFEELMRSMPNRNNNGQNFKQFYNFENLAPGNSPKLGMKVQDLEKGEGIKVISVDKQSDAEKAGLRTGDIIMAINGRTIANTEEASRMIRTNRKTMLDLKINRNGKTQNISIIQSARIKTADL